MDALDRLPKGVNCLSYAAILPILYWVMGVEAAKQRGPSPPEQAEIDRILEQALEAGACGWSMQRMGTGTAQTDFDGTPMARFCNPSLTTVVQDTSRAGELLVDTLLHLVRDEPAQSITLAPSLQVRQSSGG